MEGDLKKSEKKGFCKNYVFIELRKQNRQERKGICASNFLIVFKFDGV